MRIREILRKKGSDVVTIEPSASVQDAIQALVDHNIGGLVVTASNGSVVGIITERDILRESAERSDRLKETKVADVMTKDVLIGVPDDDLNYVMGVMTKNRIRHLPVLDESGLVGIVSIGDVVNSHLSQTEFENRMLKDYIHGVNATP
ncbi:MAG: CBS domain-containing protein [Gemmatimonadetes bacterium]|uniref:CBS domain-containing protein n=1 Tax=Candidatus Kutchimonas denitrificans TaxID=3056748 RepID=A0AAE4Z610_9BACT|nr:CBS domain-containing protein [Gemmatimonadota bacterium]NIR73999.1 CBS domain-containing protein [Candidatus Kutchimonas denitrificans]NIS02988.1 CBS domain-containing protein [Gemmatimonadota bacterium]NIT68705.1 CBS domain-containing protein [Gemmatimonadota bacterium]NIU53286.1 CBS domain-containing protein [Gemmatimonadota bacterium]